MKHFSFGLWIFSFIFLGGCAPYFADYTVVLSSVELSDPFSTRFSNIVIGETKVGCETEHFSIEWDWDWHGGHFEMENTTDKSMVINWDQSVFIDPHGYCYNVIPSGTKYIEKDRFTKPSKVMGGKKISRGVYPADFIHWLPQVGWVEAPFIPRSSRGGLDKFSEEVKSYIGKDLTVVLAIEIDGELLEYAFIFEITRASVYKGAGARPQTTTGVG